VPYHGQVVNAVYGSPVGGEGLFFNPLEGGLHPRSRAFLRHNNPSAKKIAGHEQLDTFRQSELQALRMDHKVDCQLGSFLCALNAITGESHELSEGHQSDALKHLHWKLRRYCRQLHAPRLQSIWISHWISIVLYLRTGDLLCVGR
jgi:hypothetical protein